MRNPSTTWLIIEPTFVGHRFTYLLEIVRGALARNIRVVVGVGSDAQGDRIVDRLGTDISGEAISIIRVRAPDDSDWVRGPLGLIQRAIGWWRFLSRAYKEAIEHNRIDFVFVPYLDDALFAISVFGSPFVGATFAGVTMRQRFHLREMGVEAATANGMGMKRRLFLRMLRIKELRRVYVIDDTLEAYLRLKYPELAGKLCFMPDPSAPVVVTSRDKAREILGLPGGASIVLVFGYLDARKGVSRLLQWGAGLDAAPPVHVLLAGTMSKDVERLMTSEPACSLLVQNRLWVMNRYVDSDEEQLLFSAADVVWLGYENVELMSGVLVKAAQFHKAVLFADYGLIGRYAKRYGSTPRSVSSVPVDISKLPEGIEMRFFEETRLAPDSLPDHSWENACRTIFDCLGPNLTSGP